MGVYTNSEQSTMKQTRNLLTVLGLTLVLTACRKDENGTPPGNNQQPGALNYGDSILYVSIDGNDHIVSPVNSVPGRYFGFPEGIELDEVSGAINVNKSETGLRYRISFIPDDGKDTLSTIVLLSGINYLDRIYHLEEDDTLAMPVYNGRVGNQVPSANQGSVFDEGGGCNDLGIAVNAGDARINLVQTVRNGVFGDEPKNGDHKEVEMLYRINDNSGKALNRLKVKLYYFNKPEDITEDLVQLMNDRQGMFLGIEMPPFFDYAPGSSNPFVVANNSSLGLAKPRPPCIFIVGKSKR